MARAPFSPIQPGDKSPIYASEINAWNRMVSGGSVPAGGGGAVFSSDAVIIKIQNDTGVDLQRGQAIKIGPPVFWEEEEQEKQEDLTRGVPLFKAVGAGVQVEDSEGWQEQWAGTRDVKFRLAILIDSIKADELGRAAVGGCVWAKVRRLPDAGNGGVAAGDFVLPPPSGVTVAEELQNHLLYNGGGTDTEPHAGLRVLWASQPAEDDDYGTCWAFIDMTQARLPEPRRAGLWAQVIESREITAGRWCYKLAEIITVDTGGTTPGSYPTKGWDGGGDGEDFDRDEAANQVPIGFRYYDAENGWQEGIVGFYNTWEATFQEDEAHTTAETPPVQGEDEEGEPEETEEKVWRVEPLAFGTMVWVPLPTPGDGAGLSVTSGGVRPDGKWERPTGFFYAVNTNALLDMIQEVITEINISQDGAEIKKKRVRYFGAKDDIESDNKGVTEITIVSGVIWDQASRRLEITKQKYNVVGDVGGAVPPAYINWSDYADVFDSFLPAESGSPGEMEWLSRRIYMPPGCTGPGTPVLANMLTEMSLAMYNRHLAYEAVVSSERIATITTVRSHVFYVGPALHTNEESTVQATFTNWPME